MSLSVARIGYTPPVRASQVRRTGAVRPASGQTPIRIAPAAEARATPGPASRVPGATAIQEAIAPHAALVRQAYGASEALDLMPATGRWLDRRI